MGKGQIIFMDNYYSSSLLFLHLWSLDIAAVGTVCSNRRGIPIELKEKVLRNLGDTYVMHTGPLSAIKYLDKKPVYLLLVMWCSTVCEAMLSALITPNRTICLLIRELTLRIRLSN